MELLRFAKARNWPVVFGYALFVGMMATGYYYNVTFVQLGLKDLGERVLGLDRQDVAMQMALLALLTCLLALAMGRIMQVKGWSRRLLIKLRLAFGVVVVQTLLTAAAPHVGSEALFLAWIVAASTALGVGVPAMFSMTTDLIPVRDRGYAAALIAAVAYLAAAVQPAAWTVETFSRQMLLVMAPGALLVGALAFGRWPLVDTLARQHRLPGFGRGRFVTTGPDGETQASRQLIVFVVSMFAIYFVDSLGFLRLIDTPAFMINTWHSAELGDRLFIGLVHAVTAVIAGILYTALSSRSLVAWSLGIFALTHFMNMFQTRLAPGAAISLGMPMLYATAVSLYTVLNFAIWADLSTPSNISMRAALGVALSGWTATFLSTALAIYWQGRGMSLERHLTLVDAAALLLFVVVLAVSFYGDADPARPGPRSETV